jgi:hypothetical protein
MAGQVMRSAGVMRGMAFRDCRGGILDGPWRRCHGGMAILRAARAAPTAGAACPPWSWGDVAAENTRRRSVRCAPERRGYVQARAL